MNASELHRVAMDLARQGDEHRCARRHDDARRTYSLALDAERQAALRTSAEPSRSILLRSAAWLALEAEAPREAERLAALGLAAEAVPAALAHQLREVMEEARSRLAVELPPPGGVATVGVHLEGPAIGFGLAEPEVVRPRADALLSLVYRTAERRACRSFRISGPAPADLRRALHPRQQFGAGSVVLRVALGGEPAAPLGRERRPGARPGRAGGRASRGGTTPNWSAASRTGCTVRTSWRWLGPSLPTGGG